MHEKIVGLVAAPFTAFAQPGELDLLAVERQAQLLATNGVAGAFICGTTGEGVSMSTAERQAVASQWSKVRPKNLRLIVHVGHTSLPDAKALAAHAQEIGADAIAAMAPYFFKPASLGELVDYNKELASAAPKLPFYYYHIPSMTGVNFAMHDFLQAAHGRIPTLAGIKFTHDNLMDLLRCIQFEGRRYDVLSGRDEMLLACLATGIHGAVGSTYNYAAPLYTGILAAFAEGDIIKARELQSLACTLIEILIRYNAPLSGKAMMKLCGLDLGPCRLPLGKFSDQQYDAMHKELSEAGLLSFFCKQ